MKLLKKIVFAALFIFVIFSLSRNILNYQKNLEFYEGYKREFEEKQQKNTHLKTQILKKTDPYEIEKTLRDKLNLSKVGEVTVILPLPTPTPPVTPSPIKPVYLQWIDIFFKS